MIDNQALGQRLKARRLELGLTLKAMEARAGVSATHVSEIERGRTSPTIGALHKMATALDKDLAYFLEDEPLDDVAHQRPFERVWRQGTGGAQWASLTTRIPGSRLSAFRMELPAGQVQRRSRPGEADDVFLVERGEVEFEVDGEVFQLGPGDSIHLRGGGSLRFVNSGHEAAALFQFSAYRRTMPVGHES